MTAKSNNTFHLKPIASLENDIFNENLVVFKIFNDENETEKQKSYRGYDYFIRHKAKVEKVDGDTIFGTVKGQHFYKVSYSVKNHQINAHSCECKDAENGSVCKHVCALIYQYNNRHGDERSGTYLGNISNKEVRAIARECLDDFAWCGILLPDYIFWSEFDGNELSKITNERFAHISLNKILYSKPANFVKEVIFHELCHLAANCKNSHNKKWFDCRNIIQEFWGKQIRENIPFDK